MLCSRADKLAFAAHLTLKFPTTDGRSRSIDIVCCRWPVFQTLAQLLNVEWQADVAYPSCGTEFARPVKIVICPMIQN